MNESFKLSDLVKTYAERVPQLEREKRNAMKAVVVRNYDKLSKRIIDPIGSRLASQMGLSMDLVRSYGTYSKDFGDIAKRAHNHLANVAVVEEVLSQDELEVLRLYSSNSEPFADIALRFELKNEYNNVSGGQIKQFFPDRKTGLETIKTLDRALEKLPPAKYDVKLWSKDSGKVSYRGLIARPDGDVPLYLPRRSAELFNRASSNPDAGNYGNAGTRNSIQIGDVVTNPSYMSTSAEPKVAAEFVTRQFKLPAYEWRKVPERYEVLRKKKKEYIKLSDAESAEYKLLEEKISKDNSKDPEQLISISDNLQFQQNRIFLRIKHDSGKNICSITEEKQAEILLGRGCIFKVKDIRYDRLGVMVDIEEIRPWNIEPGAVVKNYLTGETVSKRTSPYNAL